MLHLSFVIHFLYHCAHLCRTITIHEWLNQQSNDFNDDLSIVEIDCLLFATSKCLVVPDIDEN